MIAPALIRALSAGFDPAVKDLAAKGALGETLTADRIDTINSFAKPDSVVPRPYRASASGGKLHLALRRVR